MNMESTTLQSAADTLRTWALDENMKAQVMADPSLAPRAARVARRYTAGDSVADALQLMVANSERGHLGSIECIGESVRDVAVAERETEQFIELARRISGAAQSATLSLDLSHVGSVISPELGLANVTRIAQAARDAGTSVMISAEGSDRTDLVLDLYERLSSDFPETGITLQARLHRTPEDLVRVMRRPGAVRVVKGAFLEADAVAHPRDSEAMVNAYAAMTSDLVRAGHRVNIATHDPELVSALRRDLGDDLRGDHVEFEMLLGLGPELLDSLHAAGFTTREYIVYGPEWWLYVLNRIAEHPERVLTALADLNPAQAAGSAGRHSSM